MGTIRTKGDKFSKAIVAGLLAAVAMTALAHGAVEPWSILLFECIQIALILLWVIKIAREKRLSLIIPGIAFPIAALMGIGLLQSIAMRDTDGVRHSLSLDVESTRRTVIVLFFLLISFVIAANFLSSRRRLSKLAGFLTIFGLAIAVFALIQHFTWNGKLYWIRPNTVSISPFGPFVNHNHFAGYMELLIPIPIALIITGAVRGEARLLYGFAAAAMGVALTASLSRAGMLSLAAALVFLIVMSGRLRSERAGGRPEDSGSLAGIGLMAALQRHRAIASRILIVLAVAGAITAGLIWMGPEAVATRISEGQAASPGQQQAGLSNRVWVWRDTLSMIRANPLLGVGLGAYGTAFPIYTRSDGSIRVPQAHNDYLQVLADCGAVGGLIAAWFLVLTFKGIWRGVKSRDPLVAGLALGGGGAIFAILVHSLFDFNLQLPGTALLFLVTSAVVARVSTIAASERPLAAPGAAQPKLAEGDGAPALQVRGMS
jgi:O-antigen ligase